MKNILKILGLSSWMLVALWSCKKDENKDFFLGGTNPVLTAQINTGADSVHMSFADSAKTAILFSWTNPNYKFTTGVSSQNVNYQLQIDTAGDNFNPANTAVISISQDLGYNLLESQLNDIMLNTLGLAVGVPHQMETKVVSGIGSNNAVPANSNVITFTATPYVIPPKVPPPTSGALYITGSATSDGWMAGGNPGSVAGQQFTQISPTEYTITIKLTGGGEYLFIGVAGDWNSKYGCADESKQSVSGGNFEFNTSAANFPAPTQTGTYKIDVDFQRGLYTVTAQ